MDDYRLAFGNPPQASVGAIALMTDADNTQSESEGYYADIKVGYPRSIVQAVKAEENVESNPKPRDVIADFLEYIKRIFTRPGK